MFRSGAIALVAVLALGLYPLAKPQDTSTSMVPVRIGSGDLRVAPFEVTIAEWQECVGDGACEDIAPKVKHPEKTPVTGVNWFDVQRYIGWHNGKTGGKARLPTEQEWRQFSRKPEPPPRKPLFTDPRMAWAAQYGQEETPGGPVRTQGSWSHTADGIFDVNGNVWEWTASCITATPLGVDAQRCPAMKVMGAHASVLSVFVRNPASGGCATGKPPTHVGFRLVEDAV